MRSLIALAQINPHVGALEKNLDTMIRHARRAAEAGARLVVFPELALTGYPPEDLLHKPVFLDRLREMERRWHRALGELAIDAVYGSIRQGAQGWINAGVYVTGGREEGFAGKRWLPNFGVFDEQRYFEPYRTVRAFSFGGMPFGVTICEDLWRSGDPVASLARTEASFLININASPYHIRKQREREQVAWHRIVESGLPVVYVNMVGGQDELVFDGGSFAMNRSGEVAVRASGFQEELTLLAVCREPGGMVRFEPGEVGGELEEEAEIYRALTLGLGDYVAKNGFRSVVLGLSGGIDSALTAAICVDALGAERVHALMMPSDYTSQASLEDAATIAQRLGIGLETVAIGPMFDAFRRQLAPVFAGLAEDTTEENLQSRIRGTLLMALANKKGGMVVTTGNKSEVSVGYATLYGDMAGGYSVLKDLLKERVYALTRARNRWAEAKGALSPIPERVLERAPSAELRPDQKDEDSLPPYPVLDRILELYVEREQGLEEIVACGIDPETAIRVMRLVDGNEYKRRQAAPGVRVTRRAFGKDRRYPITNGFRVS
ncbi:MAG: NAD+ synthase [Magnetococcales bacterium]|nr:NAD+ synthase [Magnetococcales bacterium]